MGYCWAAPECTHQSAPQYPGASNSTVQNELALRPRDDPRGWLQRVPSSWDPDLNAAAGVSLDAWTMSARTILALGCLFTNPLPSQTIRSFQRPQPGIGTPASPPTLHLIRGLILIRVPNYKTSYYHFLPGYTWLYVSSSQMNGNVGEESVSEGRRCQFNVILFLDAIVLEATR